MADESDSNQPIAEELMNDKMDITVEVVDLSVFNDNTVTGNLSVEHSDDDRGVAGDLVNVVTDESSADGSDFKNSNTNSLVHVIEVEEADIQRNIATNEETLTQSPSKETNKENDDSYTDTEDKNNVDRTVEPDRNATSTMDTDSGIHINEKASPDKQIIRPSPDKQIIRPSPDKQIIRITIDPSKMTEKRISKRNEIRLVTLMMTVLAATIGIVVWQSNTRHCKTSSTKLLPRNVTWPQITGNAILDQNLKFVIQHDGRVTFQSHLDSLTAYEVPSSEDTNPVKCLGNRTGDPDICLEWTGSKRLTIKFTKNSTEYPDCYEVEWRALGCVSQELTDCVDIASSHWYGGFQDKHQFWPFSRTNMTMSAYVSNDTYGGEIGGVLERYFFSSNGTGIYIDNDVPLFFSINNPEGTMCFTARYDNYPYYHDRMTLPFLKYKICQGENVKEIHTKMSKMIFRKPTGIPSEDLFRYPIWSTWVQYQKDVNQSAVLAFANDILKYKFTHAQLEIDDDWTPNYGDMMFNTVKFPNASDMMRQLHDLGFKVTVWVHPFFNIESDTFREAAREVRLIRAYDSQLPALVSWWDGTAGILDVSNSSACKWFLAKLENLRSMYNLTSFKFDAGSAAYLPHIYSPAEIHTNPSDIYPRKWVELATEADTSYHQEVRVGYQTQQFPVFVRMIDRFSKWGHYNALKSVIPCALTFGLLGYPFVLPDMIGGNGQLPDPELYIRWVQMNTFLPSMQFSTVPWIYNDTILNIARKFTKMHEDVSNIMIGLARESVRTGSPIIRPLWWIAPEDDEALICETEFLVGNDILVAPVLEPGARQRDIYLPAGSWYDNLRNTSVIGGRWLVNYTAEIDELPYFSRR